MKTLGIDNTHYFFSPEIKPALYIKPGDSIIVETQDANSGLLQTDHDIPPTTEELEEIGIPGYNPVTGPIYVEGAESGDNIVVEINNIRCGSQGNQVIYPDIGCLSSPYTVLKGFKRQTKICPIKDGNVFFQTEKERLIEIPLRPIIGTIGVAPKTEKISTLWYGKEHCGNVDSPEITIGSKVILPVNIKGALLSLGDVAAISGDGELCGSHIDTTSQTRITVDVIKKDNIKYIEYPQIENLDYIGSIGCPRQGKLGDAVKAACLDLIRRLEKYFGFTILDAYQLMSIVGEIRVNQCIEPDFFSCVAKIKKKYIT